MPPLQSAARGACPLRPPSRRSGGLRSNVRTPFIASSKACGRLPIRHNWSFSYLLIRLRHYKWKSVKVGVFRKGWVTLGVNFRTKGVAYTNCCWCQNTRVIAISCAIKISAVHYLVLSQFTMHACDRQSDGWTDRQNYDSQDRASIAASRGKNGSIENRTIHMCT